MKLRWITLQNKVTTAQVDACRNERGCSFTEAKHYLEWPIRRLEVYEDGCWYVVPHVTMTYEEYENE